jgi:hypothetical protein
MEFPANKNKVIEYVKEEILAALQQKLDEREYKNVSDVTTTAGLVLLIYNRWLNYLHLFFCYWDLYFRINFIYSFCQLSFRFISNSFCCNMRFVIIIMGINSENISLAK